MSRTTTRKPKRVYYTVDYPGWGRIPRVGDELPVGSRRWCLMAIIPRINRFGTMGALLIWQCGDEWRTSGMRSKGFCRFDRPAPVTS
jgi:hypothetical protein